MDEYIAGVCVKCGYISHSNDRCVNCGSENMSVISNKEFLEIYWRGSLPEMSQALTLKENGKVYRNSSPDLIFIPRSNHD